jgi:hypothetical protein
VCEADKKERRHQRNAEGKKEKKLKKRGREKSLTFIQEEENQEQQREKKEPKHERLLQKEKGQTEKKQSGSKKMGGRGTKAHTRAHTKVEIKMPHSMSPNAGVNPIDLTRGSEKGHSTITVLDSVLHCVQFVAVVLPFHRLGCDSTQYAVHRIQTQRITEERHCAYYTLLIRELRAVCDELLLCCHSTVRLWHTTRSTTHNAPIGSLNMRLWLAIHQFGVKMR